MKRLGAVSLIFSVVPLAMLYGIAPYWSSRYPFLVQWGTKALLICAGGVLCGLLVAQSGVGNPGPVAVAIAYISSRIGPAIESPLVRRFPDILLFGAPDVVFLFVAVISALVGLQLHGRIARKRPT